MVRSPNATGRRIESERTLAGADALLAQFGSAARLLTLRGLAIRGLGVVAGLILLSLVTPAEFGLLAVVRSAATVVEQGAELGLALPLLRSPDDPSREEYAGLAGIQLLVIVIVLVVALVVPDAATLGVLDASWRPWALALLASMLVIPFGTGARIRLERSLRYVTVTYIETSAVLVHSCLVLGFTVAGRFLEGVFVAQIAYFLYLYGWYYVCSPGPRPLLRARLVLARLRTSGGFSVAYVGAVAKEHGIPLLVAALFGVGAAGLWAFAAKLGHMVQFAYEGFARVAVPAAAKVAGDPSALRRLVTTGLTRAGSLAIPVAFCAVVGLPVVPWLWPQWRDAVPLAQVFVPCVAISGVAAAALAPVALARRGARPLVIENLVPLAVLAGGLLLLALAGRENLSPAVIASHATAVALLPFLAGFDVLPKWRREFATILAAVATGLALLMLGRLLDWHVLAIGVVASAGILVWVRGSIIALLVGGRPRTDAP